jgi:hypothetical protein
LTPLLDYPCGEGYSLNTALPIVVVGYRLLYAPVHLLLLDLIKVGADGLGE